MFLDGFQSVSEKTNFQFPKFDDQLRVNFESKDLNSSLDERQSLPECHGWRKKPAKHFLHVKSKYGGPRNSRKQWLFFFLHRLQLEATIQITHDSKTFISLHVTSARRTKRRPLKKAGSIQTECSHNKACRQIYSRRLTIDRSSFIAAHISGPQWLHHLIEIKRPTQNSQFNIP